VQTADPQLGRPVGGEADGHGPVVLAGVTEGDRLAGLQPVGDLGRGGRAAAVAPEQPDRHPGGSRGQPGRHRDQDAQVVAPGDRRVGPDPVEL
jgi:hypothetical protein